MADTLEHYRKKRNFKLTPEPAEGGEASTGALRYVIQKHWASHLHYDLRLELDGAMKSWAVPKGPSLDPADKRMAVQVEDHPIAYNTFEGQIPPKQYGAGKVIVWDKGHWSPEGDAAKGYRDGKLKFELHGHKLQGRWTLVRMRGKGKEAEKAPPWLLIKEHDAHERAASEFNVVEAQPDSVARLPDAEAPAVKGKPKPTRTAPTAKPSKASKTAHKATPGRKAALPESFAPQLATLVDAPPTDTSDWQWELKFDGYRLLARVQRGAVRLFTRNGHDWTARMPELATALRALPLKSGWVDGEVLALDEHGVPNFQALQNAFDKASPAKGLAFYAFDLPYADGEDLRHVPLQERRARLLRLVGDGTDGLVRFSADFDAPPADLLTSACQIGFEGLIGKRKDAPYASRRNADWIKLKCQQRQEFIIGGFTDPQGSRTGIGSLLLGVQGDKAGAGNSALRYVGNVGSGFSEQTLKTLHAQLLALAASSAPFADAHQIAKKAHWVKPKLLAEVSFAGWTREGRLRHAVFHGLRTDKPAADIVVETPKRVATMNLSNPDRVIDAESGVTKLDLARYYDTVAPFMMEHLKARPVALVRAPDGVEGEQFFQKHLDKTEMKGVLLLDPALDEGHAPLIEVARPEGLLSASQMNVVEYHTWNARKDRIERPDRITFDLDPGEGVAWAQVQEAAQLVHAFLDELGLPAYLKTSGGKGLHVVVPIKRLHGWDEAKGFSQAVVQHLAAHIPARFVAKSGPRNRVGKIFVDYLRNGRGATTASAWSARARPGMGISVPVAWAELEQLKSGAHWTVRSVDERLRKGNAPWAGYEKAAVSLSTAIRLLERGGSADRA
ncbi:DNA ligase D [Hydrogenophaga sp.]|uniref:DNA ligase D n=1 Tax=Hydrogenophaga sp. TaxID=1904254 RepID=UPI00271A176B|nr:DNA ligase D [Hydrogenophaga sp.]MDO9434479.1 DNA ligase D [Hydrogenophaga sp.]